MTWKDWVNHGMEKQFNPRFSLGDKAETCLQDWAERSLNRQAELGGEFDISYGAHPLMQFDYAPSKTNMPVIINIHGGYWRALDKSVMMHHMADLAASGFGIANVNYPLCPEVTLTDIMENVDLALDAVVAHSDLHKQTAAPSNFILMGHSAGAHIVMHLSRHTALQGRLLAVVGISGIYEIALVRNLSVNDDVRLSVEESTRWDCLKMMPASGPAYYITVGGAEPSGWIDQSWIMADALSVRGDPLKFHVCSSANHFSLVDQLCDKQNPEGEKLHKWMVEL